MPTENKQGATALEQTVEPAPPAAAFRTASGGAPGGDLHALSAEVVSLLNEQAFTPGEGLSESEVCEAFSGILLRHWSLCCIVTFLRGDDGRLRLSASHTHPHVDEEKAHRIGELMAAEAERTGAESDVWLDDAGAAGADEDGGTTTPAAAGLRAVFRQTSLRAGVGLPIFAHGALSGVLVVLSAEPGRLRSALEGVRFIGPAILTAVGNARRGAAMNEQRRRIETLIEELRQRTAALEEANRELHRIGRYRSLFLARMSHELRTPLTSILGFAEILIDHEDLTDAQRRFSEKIQASGFQLQTSLNQLVDLSRLEAGQTELFLHEFSLREMLRESCAAVARLAQKQGVPVECQTAPDLGPVVSDEGKLRQVLYNFLAHAIGRSPTGESVRVYAAASEGDRLTIEITDGGESLSDPAHLFDPVDIDAPNERGTNMNELGLVIAHRLLGVLGGSVALCELKPAGLAVRLTLPARPTEAAPGPQR